MIEAVAGEPRGLVSVEPRVGFIDLHSHVLPGLDDGSPDLGTSITMLRGLASLGFEVVCATPHQKDGQFLPALESIRSAHTQVREALIAERIELGLPLAAENMWDQVFHGRLQDDTIPSYDNGPAFLVEFPTTALPARLEQHLFDLRVKGRLPVIAHPERYQPLWKDKARVSRLAQEAAFVVDLGAVAGYHGRREAKAARQMIKDGIAHAAASDAHTPNDVRVAAEGIAWIRKKVGDAAVVRLLETNPTQILAGQHPGG